MSEINMNKDGFYGSGGGNGAGSATPTGGGTCGGVGSIWDKLTLLERNQNKILSRLDQLENVRDAKSEPESLPIGHSLSKEQVADKLLFNKQREIEEIKQLAAEKQWALELAWSERDQYKGQLEAFKQSNESLRYQLIDRARDNEYLSGTLKNYEDRVEELDQENKNFKQTVIQQAASINNLYTKNKELEKQFKELEKTNYHQHGIITDYRNEIKQWESKKSELENDKMYWEEQVKKLQMENGDLRWRFDNPALVEQQAARECYMIIEKIKNDPLTCGEGKKWMVAVCQDVQRAIEKEFNLNG